MASEKLYVLISLDVEEGGLFSGRYPRRSLDLDNVRRLRELEPLWRYMDLPLTLFCAHSVFADPAASREVLWMRDHCGAEVAAHLHHWSTPPLGGETEKPERTHLLDRDLLARKLDNLLTAGGDLNGTPLVSFRMGRWDLKSELWPLLLERGIKVDSSICPLRAFSGGADHFLAPADPYWAILPAGKLLEAPITQIPISRGCASLWHKLLGKNRTWLDKFHFWGAMSANPLWHNDQIMRLATRLHVLRGGKVLSFFWHSSEMRPGDSPHIPSKEAAEKLLGRIFSFCRWLKTSFDIQGITASQLPGLASTLRFPEIPADDARDW